MSLWVSNWGWSVLQLPLPRIILAAAVMWRVTWGQLSKTASLTCVGVGWATPCSNTKQAAWPIQSQWGGDYTRAWPLDVLFIGGLLLL